MRLEVAPYQFATSSSADASKSGDVRTYSTNSAGGDSKLSSKVSRNIASSSTSSLYIKVPDGHKKTTPPKPAPKRSMRRRRLGDDYYYPNDGDGLDGTDKGRATSTVGVDGSRSSTASGAGNKDSRYRVSGSRRAKRETTENTGSYKTTAGTGRSKGSSSTKTLTNSLRTEDIPVGQWIVLISLLVGIFGYVRHCNKIGTSEKQSAAWKKKERKKSNIRNHSGLNSRKKGKGHSNNSHKSRTVIKRNTKKTNDGNTSNQNDAVKPPQTEHQKTDELPTDTIPEVTGSNAPIESPVTRKKKRVKKKSVKPTTPVVEDVLISSKTSPDSVSTDGSSSANISHQDRDHSVNEEDFNQSFSHDYEDYADFEVQPPEEEWTTVPTRSAKNQSSHDSEQHEEVSVAGTPGATVESSLATSKVTSQPQDKVETSNTDEKSTSDVVESADATNIPETEDSNDSKPECEVATETSYESDVTPQTNNHTNNKSECNDNGIDSDHSSQIEEGVNATTPLHTDDKCDEPIDEQLKDENVVDTSSFSQEDDEALARMLQKEEEEMAAAAEIQYELTTVSHEGPKGDDVWEEVKKKRTRKQAAVIVEEQ